jgi:metal-sulfur cluster biosynthetic enzyme
MRTLLRRFGSWWKKAPEQTTVNQTSAPAVSVGATAQPAPPVDAKTEDLVLTEELVYRALRNCRDPEIPVNIVDLGLIYDVRIAEDLVQVKMTLTTQGCGMGGYISQEAEEQIRSLPGVRGASVEIVWDPPWDPSMISQDGKKILGLPE